MLSLSDPVTSVPLIGPKYAELLSILGIQTVKDLVLLFPSYHSDTSEISKISELNAVEKKTIQGQINDIRSFRIRGGKTITEAKISDDSGFCDVVWFNQPFLTKTLKDGSIVLLNGKLNSNRNKPQLYSPTYEVVKTEETTHLGAIIPVYPTTEGITTKWLRSRVKFLLTEHTYLLDTIKDLIPQNILSRYDLLPKKEALIHIHFPKDKKILERARKRLAFEELLTIQVQLLKRKNIRTRQKAPKISAHKSIVSEFIQGLPFKPTKAQITAIEEITSDFKKAYPANRLLQGDVGSGKTLVAAAVSIPVIESGFQVALMAPTAILAKQHFETLKEFLGKKYEIQLVTGTTKSSDLPLISNSSQLIIGTHALLHRQAKLFNRLGLIIVDEQHRFGVKQRSALSKKQDDNMIPHKITMTATPIPRSIALTLFGDLDVSVINEMPEGRIPTSTHLVPDSKRKDAYQWLENKVLGNNNQRQNISHKSQIFWICPLIEESEKIQTKAVISEYKRLETEIFPKLRVDLLHGKLSEEEKTDKVKRMSEGKTDVMVSTTVIEVGIDIPKADIMVIEGAERFGLAQLHQLRGRVGRKANQESWCFLFVSKNASPEAVERLKYFSKTNDGLMVAKYDLKRRGPGEVYGTKQAGIPDLKIASLNDLELIKQTRGAAGELILIR